MTGQRATSSAAVTRRPKMPSLGPIKADQMLLQLNSAVTEQITNMMLTVHAIAKSG